MTQNQSLNENRYERRKEETRKRIIRVAMDLFKRQGFDSTTMEQIAAEADIAKKTLYNHFAVKEAIISEYIHRAFKQEAPAIIKLLQELPDTRSRLITVLRMSLEWIEVEFDKDLYKKYFAYRMQILEQSIKDQSLRSGFHSALAHIIGLGQKAGEIRKDIPAEVLAHQFESVHAFTIAAWLAIPEDFPVHKSIAWNVELFLNGAMDRESKE